MAKGLWELILPFAIICLANGVRTKVAGRVAVASTPLPATVRIAIVVSRIAATVRAKTRPEATIVSSREPLFVVLLKEFSYQMDYLLILLA